MTRLSRNKISLKRMDKYFDILRSVQSDCFTRTRNARKKFSLASWACKTCFRNIRDKRKFIRIWKSLNLITALQIRVFHYANALPTNFIRCALFLFISTAKVSAIQVLTAPEVHDCITFHYNCLLRHFFARQCIHSVPNQPNEPRIFIFRFFDQFILIRLENRGIKI